MVGEAGEVEQYEVWEWQREKREKADPLWLQGLEKFGPSQVMWVESLELVKWSLHILSH